LTGYWVTLNRAAEPVVDKRRRKLKYQAY